MFTDITVFVQTSTTTATLNTDQLLGGLKQQLHGSAVHLFHYSEMITKTFPPCIGYFNSTESQLSDPEVSLLGLPATRLHTKVKDTEITLVFDRKKATKNGSIVVPIANVPLHLDVKNVFNYTPKGAEIRRQKHDSKLVEIHFDYKKADEYVRDFSFINNNNNNTRVPELVYFKMNPRSNNSAIGNCVLDQMFENIKVSEVQVKYSKKSERKCVVIRFLTNTHGRNLEALEKSLLNKCYLIINEVKFEIGSVSIQDGKGRIRSEYKPFKVPVNGFVGHINRSGRSGDSVSFYVGEVDENNHFRVCHVAYSIIKYNRAPEGVGISIEEYHGVPKKRGPRDTEDDEPRGGYTVDRGHAIGDCEICSDDEDDADLEGFVVKDKEDIDYDSEEEEQEEEYDYSDDEGPPRKKRKYEEEEEEEYDFSDEE